MVAKSGKFILMVFFLIAPLSNFARDDLPDISESAFNISLQKFKLAEKQLESAIANCTKNSKPVPVSLITPLGMNIDAIKIALFVLNDRAEATCEAGAREKFFFAAAIHREVARHYQKNAGDAVEYTEDLMLSHYWKKLEFEAKYLDIDEDIRTQLEAIEELKVPFLIFATLDQVEGAK